MADLPYECLNTGPHGPHTWTPGMNSGGEYPLHYCEGIPEPPLLPCPGSGRSWIWDKGAAVCQRCHEPATWMGLRPPRRHSGAFTTKVPPHVNRMPAPAEFSQKAQIQILQDEKACLIDALRKIAQHPSSGDANDDHRMRSIAQEALAGV